MGIGETLKDYYYKAEDAWYKFVDKVSDKLPVFGTIVDKIEEKKIPTFPVAIALVLILLFVILFLLFGTSSALTVIVKDSNGNIVSAAQVTLYESGTQVDFRETDTTGKAIFYVQNSKYSIKVDKQGYTSLTKNDLTPSEINFVLAAIDEQITKTISLKNSSGQLINGTGTVVYSCVGSSEQRYSNYENGKFNADFTDCAEIQIDSISGYTIIEGKASFSSADNIILDEVEQTTSTVTVQLNSVGNELPTGLKVMLYDNEKVLFNTAYSNSNVVVFSNVVTNSYYVVVSDPSGEFNDYDGSTLGEIKELRKNEPISFSVNLTKSVSSSINITVKDAETGLPISGVEVKRKSTTNQNDLDTLITGNSGQVTFLVPQGSSYLITAEHPNYLIGDGKTVSANESATFNLIEANESNSQTLLVRVKDPQGAGISGTRVVLKRTDDTIVDEKITGYNGEVEFYNLEFGSYFVFATKTGFASVTTPSTQVLPRRTNTLDVVIDIGTGIIRLNVNDESGIVAGASVKAINVTGETEKESSTDGEGKADFSIRIDKEVYFVIEAPNKASYYTSSMRADTGVLTEKDIMLKDSTGGLNVTLLGIYSGNETLDEESEVINSGTYTAKLLLEVPKGNYTEAGIHIRTGKAENNTTNLMEEDSIAIGKILASTTKTTKGKTYSPINGYTTDSQNLTQGTAKWANIIWNNPSNALYEVEAEILVTDSLSSTTENFWYRAWTKGSNNLKNPISNVGGNDLYSNAKVRLFSLNSEIGSTLCSGSFCKIYSIETLTGKNSGRKQGITNTFNAQQGNTYILTADLINLKAISGAVLELEGRGINIEEITVNGTTTIDDSAIVLGGLTTDAFTKLEIKFSTNTSGSGTISLKINSATKTEFEDAININIASNKKFTLDIIPKQLIPYIANTFFFTVKDNNSPLPRTIIEIKDDYSTLGTIETSGEGLAQFELAAPKSGDKFTIVAKKEGYETITITKEVDDRILLLTPNEINETIKIGEVTSINQTVIFTNQTVSDIKIKKVSVGGDLSTYLNIEYPNIEGTTINSGEDSNYSITLKVNSNAQRLSQPLTVNGTIKFETEISGTTQNFENILPVSIRLSMPGYLDNDKCLKVTPGAIEFITSSNEATQTLEIENTCVAEGIKINLTELEAKLSEASNLGTVMVSGTGFNSAALTDTFTKIAQIFEKDAKQSLTVRFVPSASVTSGEQELKISFRGKNVIDTDESETVEASTTMNVSMSNLSKCIEVSKPSTGLILEVAGWNLGYDRLVTSNLSAAVNQYQGFSQRGRTNSSPYGLSAALPFTSQQNSNYEEDKFTIKNTCAVDIEIDLDPDSRISVSEETFTIGKDSDATVTVSPGYTLGKYNISVNAKLAGTSDTKRKTDNVSVTVRKLGDIDTSCIKVNVTTLNFNSFIYKAERHKAFNYCYDSGVMLDRSNTAVTVQCDAPNASTTGIQYFQTGNQYNQLYNQQYPMGVQNQMGNTINSYYDYLTPTGTNTTNSCAMVSGTRVVDRSVKESSSGSIEEITFEVLPSSQYIQQRRLFNSQNQTYGLFNSLADIRQWATETDARTNIYGNLNVKYTNQYGSMQTMSFPVELKDVWRLGESIDSAINWGDPNARPEQCVDEERTNNSLNIKEYWDKKGNTKGAIPETQYTSNKTIYKHIAEPPAVRIGPASNTGIISNTFNASQQSNSTAANCGLLDSISNLVYDKEYSGVKVVVETIGSGSWINETRGPNLAVQINRSGITQDCVYIDTIVSAKLTRKINFQSGPVQWNLKAIVTRPGYTLQTDNPEIECKAGATSGDELNCDSIIRNITAQNKDKSTSEIKELVRKEEAKCADLVTDALIDQIKEDTADYSGTCENSPKEFGFDNINKTSLAEISDELSNYCENNYCSTEMFSGYIFDKYYNLKQVASSLNWKATTSGKLSELYKEAQTIKIGDYNYYSNDNRTELVRENYKMPENYFNAGQKENIITLTTANQGAISDMIAVLEKVKTADTDTEVFLETKTTEQAVKNLGNTVGTSVYISLDKYLQINKEIIDEIMSGNTAVAQITIDGAIIKASTLKIIAENSKLVELVREDTLKATDTNKIDLIYAFNEKLKTMNDLANKTVYLANIKKLGTTAGFALPAGLNEVNKFSETITGFSQAGKYILQIDLNYKELNSVSALKTEIKLSQRTAESKVHQNILLTNDFKFGTAKSPTNTIADNSGIYSNIPLKITATVPGPINSLIYKLDNYSSTGELINWKYNNQKLTESNAGGIRTISIPTTTSSKIITGTYFHPIDEILIVERIKSGSGSITVNGLIINNEVKTETISSSNAARLQFTNKEKLTLSEVVALVKEDNACPVENKIIWNQSKMK